MNLMANVGVREGLESFLPGLSTVHFALTRFLAVRQPMPRGEECLANTISALRRRIKLFAGPGRYCRVQIVAPDTSSNETQQKHESQRAR